MDTRLRGLITKKRRERSNTNTMEQVPQYIQGNVWRRKMVEEYLTMKNKHFML